MPLRRNVPALAVWALTLGTAALAAASLPQGPLVFGAFEASFEVDGSYSVEGSGWPTLEGSWTTEGSELRIETEGVPNCEGIGRYTWSYEAPALRLTLLEDDCRPRQMILGASVWYPPGQQPEVPERVLEVERLGRAELPAPSSAEGSWPSFRGPQASGVVAADPLPPTQWNVATGENVLWSVDVPGLGHASPSVWGDRVFIATAVSSAGDASFKPGLYGDGDADADRSEHRFELHAYDRTTGDRLWHRVAATSAPKDKRHIKSTYANSTPATDGRVVVTWFGSQGVFAYTVEGDPLWSADLGRLNLGAYDVPSYEWGPASSPILWRGRVILQCDTQQDSFLVALDAATGEVLWKTDREELPGRRAPSGHRAVRALLHLFEG
ncbi:MAG: PQQ-binding-like beta-propeller repeat protein, partial [Acidobacteriota bacterium]